MARTPAEWDVEGPVQAEVLVLWRRIRTRCAGGPRTEGAVDEVVEATIEHGQRPRNMAVTREQVLEHAEAVAADEDAR